MNNEKDAQYALSILTLFAVITLTGVPAFAKDNGGSVDTSGCSVTIFNNGLSSVQDVGCESRGGICSQTGQCRLKMDPDSPVTSEDQLKIDDPDLYRRIREDALRAFMEQAGRAEYLNQTGADKTPSWWNGTPGMDVPTELWSPLFSAEQTPSLSPDSFSNDVLGSYSTQDILQRLRGLPMVQIEPSLPTGPSDDPLVQYASYVQSHTGFTNRTSIQWDSITFI
jgi:hypothetical protein